MEDRLTIVLPAKNEADNLDTLLPAIREHAPPSARILVVDDGSTDRTGEVCAQHEVERILVPQSLGNGAAIKRGLRAAGTELVMFMDADGQHRPEDIPHLLEGIDAGFDMVVGARSAGGQASTGRWFANALYNRLASWVTETPVADLTSGFRVARVPLARRFLPLLPNGFSYPTTLTMAFLRSGHSVAFRPIRVLERGGRSHIRPIRDGLRFLVLIFRIATLYSPLKIFLPISLAFTVLGGGHYLYTYVTSGRFTNMTALLFSVAVIVFLIGLVSEQITQLTYMTRGESPEED